MFTAVKNRIRNQQGLAAAAAGAFSFALTGILLNLSHRWDPTHSIGVDALFRVFVNLAILFLPWTHLMLAPRSTEPFKRRIAGDLKWDLWLWGFLGGLTLFAFYASIVRIGISEAAFLQCSQGIFIAMLSPKIAKQSVPTLTWMAILGSCLGMALLFRPQEGAEPDLVGRALALFAGLTAGLAYLVLARIGRRVSAIAISFYWSIAGALVIFVLSWVQPMQMPSGWQSFTIIAFAAVIATVGQLLTTLAYQKSPAAQVAAITYLVPVFGLLLEISFLGRSPSLVSWIGAIMIVCCGAFLPFLRPRGGSEIRVAPQDSP